MTVKKILYCAFYLLFSAFSLFSFYEKKITNIENDESRFLKIFSLGEKFRQEGEYNNSIKYFNDCLDLIHKKSSIKYEPEVLKKLGLLFWNIGQLKDSLNYYLKAKALSQELGIKENERECEFAIDIYKLYNEGKEYRLSSKYQKSIESFKKAIDLAKKIKSPEHELKCLRQMSLNYWDLSNYREFYILNKAALEITKKIKNKKDEGICLNNIGLYFWKIDNYSHSLKYYEEALEIAQSKKDTQAETDILNNIGIIYKEMGNYDKALSYLTKALVIDQKYFRNNFVSIDLNNIGTTYRKKGLISNKKEDFQKALEYFNQCLKLIQNLNDNITKIRVLNNLGTAYSDLEMYLEALKYYELSLSTAESIKDKEAMSNISNNIGIVQYYLGNYEESIKYCQKAIDLALEFKGGQILWEAFFELANAYKKQNKIFEALKNYKNSISIIEGARSAIEIEELKASYLGTDKRIEAYNNLIDLLVHLNISESITSYKNDAFNYLEKEKARAFLDSLEVSEVNISQGIDIKLSYQEKQLNNEITNLYKKLVIPELTIEQKKEINEKLQNYEDQLEKLKREIRAASPAYANLKYPKIITLKEAQDYLLDDKTAFFAYTIGKESSYGFAITKNDLKIFPISLRKDIQNKVSAYLKAITDRENHDFHLGFELYSELVRPGLDRNVKRIFFIPDDILYFLPFETLQTERNSKQWLVNNFTVGYAPSLSSLREIVKRERQNEKKPNKDLLAFGDPAYGNNEFENSKNDIFQNFYSSSAFKFFRLRYSGVEVQKIASLFKKNKEEIYLREKASEQEIKKLNLDNFKIIHFAAHGLIDSQKPARSAIVLSLNQDSQEDGFVQMREIYNMRMNADLVVLSACQTGLGQFIRGEGIEGLSRAFFYAGASSVLMTLWSVNDQASSQLMETFYRHLRSSTSIMEALQKAKLEMIQSKSFSHPYYWAGFVITGNASRAIFSKSYMLWITAAIFLCLGGLLLIGIKKIRRNKRTA